MGLTAHANCLQTLTFGQGFIIKTVSRHKHYTLKAVSFLNVAQCLLVPACYVFYRIKTLTFSIVYYLIEPISPL